MSKNDLRKQLQELIINGEATYREYAQTTDRVNALLASAYLKWRDFQADPEFLEKEYKKAGITYRIRNKNKIPFRPYVRLVCGVKSEGGGENTATHWGDTLNFLHDAYVANEDYYRSNALGKLIDTLKQAGGVQEIAINKAKEEADSSDIVKPTAGEAKKLIADKLTEEQLAERSLTLFKSDDINGIGVAQPDITVRADVDNLVALIGRREKDGTITLLGSTNATDAIQSVALHSAERSHRLLPPVLAQLTEVILTQMYPQIAKPKNKAALKAWRDRIYYDQTGTHVGDAINAPDDKKKKKEKMTNPRRVLLRGRAKDIVFSSMRSPRSVVTHVRPDIQLAPATHSIYLKTDLRNKVENAIANRAIEVMDTTPKQSLLAESGTLHTHSLAAVNPYSGEKLNLLFYQFGRERDKVSVTTQTNFRFKEHTAKWKARFTSDWLRSLRTAFLDEWFASLGRNTQLNRENNFMFDVTLSPRKMRIKFNMGITSIAPFEDTDLNITLLGGLTEFACKFRSKDIAPVLYNISDLAILRDLSVSGSEDAMVIEFTTHVGSFKIAIPTYVKNSRNIPSSFYLLSSENDD